MRRVRAGRSNSRAQLFGLGAGHGLAHPHRSVMEGVAFAAARHLHIMEKDAGHKLDRVIGCAAMAATATGRFSALEKAVDPFVKYVDEVQPDPAWRERHARDAAAVQPPVQPLTGALRRPRLAGLQLLKQE
jgi:xylulokinase